MYYLLLVDDKNEALMRIFKFVIGAGSLHFFLKGNYMFSEPGVFQFYLFLWFSFLGFGSQQ